MNIAEFQKVSIKQFNNDLSNLGYKLDNQYSFVCLPTRATVGSAGYDFVTPVDVIIKPNEMVKIPSGIRCKIDNSYVLSLYPRSSLGIKKNITLANTVGIIDSDYYNAENEGHIIIALVNNGKSDVELKAGERIVQGIFTKYYLALEEEVTGVRTGGIGSSNK